MSGDRSHGVFRRMRPMLGTFVEVGVEGEAEESRAVFERAYAAIERVGRCLSFHDPGSELSRLNRTVGVSVTVSPLTARLLRLGRALSLASGGLFNCTVGGALVRRGLLPDHGGPAPLDCGVAADVEIRGSQVRLLRPVRITLDGIAKGYAVDCAIRALKACGARLAWVNAGGDIRAYGALALPVFCRDGQGTLHSLGGLRDAAIATSVVRESPSASFPGTIVAPDGTPAHSGTWSVLAHSAWRADALTKVAALAPPSLRASLLRRLGGAIVGEADGVH